MDELRRLQAWYDAQCDGDWEHEFGVRIETLDNPGWSVRIPLKRTELEDVPFAEVNDTTPERDWLFCRVEEAEWRGAGGPLMLPAILRRFLDWAAAVRPEVT